MNIVAAQDKPLKSSVDALRAENERLQAFSYRVSHDLKSPLRAVMALTEWIVEDLRATFGELPDNISCDLTEISAQSARMSKMIDDLLSLAQIGGHDEPDGACDTGQAIVESLRICDVPGEFDVRLQPTFPPVACHPVEFSTMIRNLLNNSIEHHDQASGIVEIAAWQADGFCHFRVRDDGPGVSAEHRDYIFEMFNKLGPGSGSGIGLAMVRQIAQQYGGSAYVQPNPLGRGSDFIISLPLAQKEGCDIDPPQ